MSELLHRSWDATFDAAAEPKQYVVIPGVGHNDQDLLDGRQMIGDVLKFLGGTPVLGR